MTEPELIGHYKKDFNTRTGKSIKISICSRWESICQLPSELSMPMVVDIILDAAGWKWEQVFTVSRRSEFIYRRGLVYFILVKSGFPLLKIASFSDREHATIINSYRKFEHQLDTEPLTGKVLLEVMEFISANYSLYLDK
ncbi:hypothetical protein HGH93_23505 [Chitinophaga polysaccharea]|uniref:hypothetical protein n=1 Tax=Chitinophaga polysaccharea TaxID=1293035 RepID=UPI0014559DD7|nr:hypothetical protein [Chitinophaga polysaccharea]NLR61088.1 hypothetical protein [Chitinophaga polysaccharea]